MIGLPHRGIRAAAWLPAWILLFAPLAAAASFNPGRPLQVDLITVGPGATYWERFGHNAIRVRFAGDTPTIAYNYGIFDFGQKNFLLNFVRGRMSYRLVGLEAERDLAGYIAEDRSVRVQTLALSEAQKLRLVEFLEHKRQPENAAYRYDYFLNNCSTKVRDALDLALGGALAAQFQGQPTTHSFREFTNRYAAPVLWMYLGTQLALARPTDRPISRWQTFFIPEELMRAAADTVLVGGDGRPRKLVLDTRVLHRSQRFQVPPSAPDWSGWFLLGGLAMAALLWMSGRRPSLQRLLVCAWWSGSALLGLAMLALWVLTAHQAAHGNENLLIFSPLCLLPAIAWMRGRPRRRTALILAALVLAPLIAALAVSATPWLYQHNGEFLAFGTPLHAVAALVFYRAAAAGQA